MTKDEDRFMDTLKHYTDDKVFKPHELVQAYFHDKTFPYTPIHTHNFYELNIVMSGNGKHHVNDATFYIANGDVFIMPPKSATATPFILKTIRFFIFCFIRTFSENMKHI